MASLDTSAAVSASKNAVRPGSDIAVMRRGPNVLTYKIKKGDTLFALARKYNTTVAELQKLNNLKNSNLKPGRQLRVPGTLVRG
ncbi:LysM peptidoglycan-binding domain-containing protein [Paenalcaligenes niemegkensis]|uniref:LysM peptidoglycan-binding domain-containing protein n=1 Tax=Paenalcaligenes niemegkensis TaxID=2895469 RepID=UPI0035679C81